MKKIAIITLVVILAIFAFFYVQIQKLETKVTAKLAQHELSKSLILAFFRSLIWLLKALNTTKLALKN